MASVIHLPSTTVTHPLRHRWLGTRAYWLCQFAGWGGLLVICLTPMPFSAGGTLAEVVFYAFQSATGLALSHLLRVAILGQLRETRSWVSLTLRLVPWVLAAAIAHIGLLLRLTMDLVQPDALGFDSSAESESFTAAYLNNLTLSLSFFVIWTGFYLGLRYYRQYQLALIERLQLAAAVKDADLRALKAQLNPHFLFNSLNTLRALIPPELERPREAVTQLSELLRASLTLGQDETVPLSCELASVDNYLALERLRFEDRLRLRRAIQPAALNRHVPPFLVQTLVENALKYGLAPREQGADITLEAFLRGDTLRIRVTNPGTLAPLVAGTGLGLKNSRARLALLFGPDASLNLRQAGDDIVEAEAILPPPLPRALAP
ncbi:MAG: histidine kinase [Opitutus sp.]|nr:histidine kinase [Opitutus sp.]MCS6248468.1 histidine kinase [Opitutus sp.]MCS6274450.1 histidine kinase [Opitutus sp.]MCS6277594.1 histidine kinase [Opitutus sp.]MCS6300712.1 histidine kinase [Opitutus sp.]